MATYLEEAQALYPNLSATLLNLFAQEWAKSGNPVTAIQEVDKQMNIKQSSQVTTIHQLVKLDITKIHTRL